MEKFLIIIILFTMTIQPIKSQNPAENILPVVKCSDFVVNGLGSDGAWAHTNWINLVQYKTSSPYTTRFKILYSDSGIYCLYECADNEITATLRGNNLDLYNEDVVEAFFWANEKVPVYFEYELSPLNYELILMVPNYDGKFLGWIPWHYSEDRVTRHAVSTKKDQGGTLSHWIAEFFIPFELMKPMVEKTPEKGTTWRANFYRIDYDKKRGNWSWMPIQKNFHDYLLFGTIQFQ